MEDRYSRLFQQSLALETQNGAPTESGRRFVFVQWLGTESNRRHADFQS
jgi:hypothetical protein